MEPKSQRRSAKMRLLQLRRSAQKPQDETRKNGAQRVGVSAKLKVEEARKKAQGQKRKLGGITHHCGYCDYSALRPCWVRKHEARIHEGWDELTFCNYCAYKTTNENDGDSVD